MRGQPVPCRFCGGPDGDGHLFLECTFLPLRENPEFHHLVRKDKGHWPRCLLWHGWLPVNGASPWAETASQGAGALLESALGSYSSRLLFDWSLLGEVGASDAATRVPDNPDVWTDGSLVLNTVSGAS